jgi:hypothetical protein
MYLQLCAHVGCYSSLRLECMTNQAKHDRITSL